MRRIVVCILLMLFVCSVTGVASADESYHDVDDIVTKDQPLIMSMDLTAGEVAHLEIEVAADIGVSVKFMDKLCLWYLFALRMDSRAIPDLSGTNVTSFSLSVDIDLDDYRGIFYYVIYPTDYQQVATVDADLLVLIDYDGDGKYSDTDVHPMDHDDLLDGMAELEDEVGRLQGQVDALSAKLYELENRTAWLEGDFLVHENELTGDIEAIRTDVDLLKSSDGTGVSREELDDAMSEARSARNVGMTAGGAGIVIGAAALVFALRGRGGK